MIAEGWIKKFEFYILCVGLDGNFSQRSQNALTRRSSEVDVKVTDGNSNREREERKMSDKCWLAQ